MTNPSGVSSDRSRSVCQAAEHSVALPRSGNPLSDRMSTVCDSIRSVTTVSGAVNVRSRPGAEGSDDEPRALDELLRLGLHEILSHVP